ncbi:type II toxin-antitoxin system HicB family antitoxin [Desulfoscipio geothermicus]|jgi:predicted RNase H-like HicB family nuclease|uniref:type II toxin-antitoxin system HicB family antitoxin n=1 Tax=Desulfoscipio geothermicus TaxID=39060 RepID=UPI000B82B899|nr:type II toxin-antitoxin system HicB family antitoxin [Desulfoscipio geothermicus]
MNIKYPVVITKLAGGEWLAEHKDLPGWKIHGSTPEEAITRLEEVKLLYRRLVNYCFHFILTS